MIENVISLLLNELYKNLFKESTNKKKPFQFKYLEPDLWMT